MANIVQLCKGCIVYTIPIASMKILAPDKLQKLASYQHQVTLAMYYFPQVEREDN